MLDLILKSLLYIYLISVVITFISYKRDYTFIESFKTSLIPAWNMVFSICVIVGMVTMVKSNIISKLNKEE